MDNTISILLKIFESFFKRAILPSFVLLICLYFLQMYDDNVNILPFLIKENYFIIIIMMIPISFFMSIATQIIFDNRMKANFNGCFFSKEENSMLELLRSKAIKKLEKEDDIFNGIKYTDYFLYQALGRKLAFIKPETKTTRYMDEIKSSGIIFISLIITIVIKMIVTFNSISLVIGVPLVFLVWFVAREYLKSKYRSRAIRIYVNYLIGDSKVF